jgi:hypothetical protein
MLAGSVQARESVDAPSGRSVLRRASAPTTTRIAPAAMIAPGITKLSRAERCCSMYAFASSRDPTKTGSDPADVSKTWMRPSLGPSSTSVAGSSSYSAQAGGSRPSTSSPRGCPRRRRRADDPRLAAPRADAQPDPDGRAGRRRARTINSENRDDWEEIRTSIERDDVDLFLVSPERFNNPASRTDVLALIVLLLVLHPSR